MLNYGTNGGGRDNVIAELGTIQNIYRDPEPRDNTGKYDFQLVVDVKLDKNGWDRKIWIKGAFKRNQMGVIEGVGSTFKAANLFIACGYPMDQVNRMDELGVDAYFQGCIGKQIAVLSYKTNKDKWSTSENVGSPLEMVNLKANFIASWQDKGYPKNYIGPEGASRNQPTETYGDPSEPVQPMQLPGQMPGQVPQPTNPTPAPVPQPAPQPAPQSPVNTAPTGGQNPLQGLPV